MVDAFIQYIALVYVVLFLLMIVSLVYRVKKQTGVFGIIRTNEGAYGYVDKIVLLTYLGIICNAVFFGFQWYPLQIFIPMETHILVQVLGVVLVGIALVCMYVAQLQMGSSWRIGIDTEHSTDLVQKGFFQYFRHPIYFFAVLVGVGAAILIPSVVSVVLFLFLYVALNIQSRLEEEHMLSEHGDMYREYIKKHRRWF